MAFQTKRVSTCEGSVGRYLLIRVDTDVRMNNFCPPLLGASIRYQRVTRGNYLSGDWKLRKTGIDSNGTNASKSTL